MCLVDFMSTLDAEFRWRKTYPEEQKSQAGNKKKFKQSIMHEKSNENTEMLEKS